MKVFFALFASLVVALGLANPVSAQPQCSTLAECNVDVSTASTPAVDVNDTNYTYTVPQYLEWVVKDADAQWTAWFKQVGLREPFLYYHIVPEGSSYTTACRSPNGQQTVGANFPNAFYCSIDSNRSGAIVLPVLTFQQMWDGNFFGTNSGTKGDFGAAAVVAHEFGHHIQDELTQQTGIARPAGKNKELIADCFAGNWTSSLYQRGGLDDGDLEEAVSGLFAIGDPDATVQSHGTGPERIQALKIGLQGNPFSCFRTYWPQILSG